MKVQQGCETALFGILVLGMGLGGCSSPASRPDASTPQLQQSASAVRPHVSDATARLLEAAFAGQTERVSEALDRVIDPNARDQEGRTSLMLAAFNGHTDIARLLLDGGAQVNARDPVGRTSLMYAATGPNQETVRVLLEHKADPLAADQEEQFTALMFAAAEGQAEVVRLLLGHGSDPAMVDTDGDTALDFAVRNNHTEVAGLLRNHTQSK